MRTRTCVGHHGIKCRSTDTMHDKTHTMMTKNVAFMSHNRAVSQLQTSEVQLESCVVPMQHRPLQTGCFNSYDNS